MEPRVINQAFSVSYDFPVVFTRGLFSTSDGVLAETVARRGETRRHRIAVFIDDSVANARPALAGEVEKYLHARPELFDLVAPPRTVPGGERCKNNLQIVGDLIAVFALNKMDRHAFVIVIGGGAVLDAVGFAAALFHRGLRLIRVPTTVLAQNDAGVGVKNAINFLNTKNLLGTFAPPFAVLNDLDFLRTLPEIAWTDGIAEAFKVAIIKDANFFARLCEIAPRLHARDEAAMEELVVRCAELHLEHIRSNGDPFEFGQARPLDFGHWSAHKLEQMSDYAVSHGAAVATGIALDSWYAAKKGWLDATEFDAIYAGLRRAGFSLWHDLLEKRGANGSLELLNGLRDFQEHLGGELCVTMPRGLGAKFEIHEMETQLIESAIAELKRRSIGGFAKNMRQGQPVRYDSTATSADPALPGFLARPSGAPVYHGFEIIKDSETDGWYYGAITDYETPEPSTEGDGFIVAPDGTRAGIAWAIDTPEFYEICPPDKIRWGVYGVCFPRPVANKSDLINNF